MNLGRKSPLPAIRTLDSRLPTEAEWEWAARGGLVDNIYPWGNEPLNTGKPKTNSWDGTFPYDNSEKDGFYYAAPVKSFHPNGYGLYDMAGNVWEWCSDWYRADYYEMANNPAGVTNPQGPADSFVPDEPYAHKKSIRGGSFLCKDSYSFRLPGCQADEDDPRLGYGAPGVPLREGLKNIVLLLPPFPGQII